MEYELPKPCPFCGTKDVFIFDCDGGKGEPVPVISCLTCGVSMRSFAKKNALHAENLNALVRSWNTRVDIEKAASTAMLAALRK